MELEKGIEGYSHFRNVVTQHIKHPSKIVGIGDIVEGHGAQGRQENQKISLGFKQLEPDPWSNVTSEFPMAAW